MQDVADVAKILEGKYVLVCPEELNGLDISPHNSRIAAESAVGDATLAQLVFHPGLYLCNALCRVLAATHDKVHVALARFAAPHTRCRAGRVLVQDCRNLR